MFVVGKLLSVNVNVKVYIFVPLSALLYSHSFSLFTDKSPIELS